MIPGDHRHGSGKQSICLENRRIQTMEKSDKPTNVIKATTTLLPTGSGAGSTQNKQQKVDDDMLMGWKRTRKDAKDYPVLNEDEYYTEWLTQILR